MKRSGFILVLAMLLISLGTLLVVPLAQRVMVHRQLMQIAIARERAGFLLFDGIQIALDHIESVFGAAQDKEKKEKNAEQFLALCGRWQQFSFEDTKEHVAGKIALYLVPEASKININLLYDFEKKEFIKTEKVDARALLKALGPLLFQEEQNSLDARMAEIFAERKKPFDDITELLKHSPWNSIPAVFPQAPEDAKSVEQKKKIALTDIFSTLTTSSGIYPLTFSESFQEMLSFNRRGEDNQEEGNKRRAQALLGSTDWSAQWQTMLAERTGKNYTDINAAIRAYFAPSLQPEYFSVVVYATVGTVTRGMCAILAKIEKPSEKSKKDSPEFSWSVTRLYWL